MANAETYDVAVIGAGVFGAWTAHELQKSHKRVILLDAYGPANSRASSGGESRIIRMGYGADEIYTRWSMRSLRLWQEFFRRVGQPLFCRTGMLWMARDEDQYALETQKTLEKAGLHYERLSRVELEKRYPQLAFGPVAWGLLEPESGVLMARRAVQAVVGEAVKSGTVFLCEAVAPPSGKGRLSSVTTTTGRVIHAGCFIFACGPWLPKVFPEVLEDRLRPTRQEVYFFGPPPGSRQFAPPEMPAWFDFAEEVYSVPDLENRGIKFGFDSRGPAFDPDTGERVVTSEGLLAVREILAGRVPGLKGAPLVESRVCQYEDTCKGDFLIDRHPAIDNVWIVGGGSGHGFKHGPSVGEYVAARITQGGPVDPRFSLATKDKFTERAVF